MDRKTLHIVSFAVFVSYLVISRVLETSVIDVAMSLSGYGTIGRVVAIVMVGVPAVATAVVVVSTGRFLWAQRAEILSLTVLLLCLIVLLLAMGRTNSVPPLAGPGGPAVHILQDSGQAPPRVVTLWGSQPQGGISEVFTPEVKHWEPWIVYWAQTYGLDPNLVAIIMQIESCGDPQAGSRAGAQGLFQVMPFHFARGEDMQDPDTNAMRGLTYFVDGLQRREGDIGLAFAGYNGGHNMVGRTHPDNWPAETKRYYQWSTGIYGDIQAGHAESPTLQQWLEAGGASLCRQAARRLGL